MLAAMGFARCLAAARRELVEEKSVEKLWLMSLAYLLQANAYYWDVDGPQEELCGFLVVEHGEREPWRDPARG